VREKKEKKKEMVVDNKLETKKKHVLFGHVGTIKRISLLPWKTPYSHVPPD